MALDAVLGIFRYNSLERELLSQSGDSNLILRHSQMVEVKVSSHPQPIQIRIANIPHQERHLGSVVSDLPLIFFVHGLGGQLNQFEYILDTLSFTANVVALDLPGHGKSPFVESWDLYSSASYVEICRQVLEHPAMPKHRRVVLVGHSMGAVLCTRLAPLVDCAALVALTPPWKPEEERVALRKKQRYLGWVPPPLFDVLRAVVRAGGTASPSVKSMVGPDASESVLRRQLRTNLQSNTKTWLRTAYGFDLGPLSGEALRCPCLAIAASSDRVVPAAEVEEYAKAVGATLETVTSAGHALLIEKPQVVCALLNATLRLADERLDMSWQLQHIAKQSDKWSLKNEQKWLNTPSIGKLVGNRLRGMKTLRQDDNSPHSPSTLPPEIKAVIDISREAPSYDPKALQCEYHKYPTVAKIPPTREEVQGFIELVDSIDGNIAVHCHYGFNRTGFLICCWLVERRGLSVAEALKAYKQARPTGVHHANFIDELYLRYDR